ncbi:hypothetical protein TTHERM_00145840 (macronuclear) [Tetrahymena thermophila SB210]|uniref:Uncharacterized protein n=1 Tax=Tetrahymena thermophila (strain SB210) TaxID=312017 RepID=I7MI83_TETTS|nr:hypothetical protein TTHERM_00145840 [Tetrahymena thermophila SB210]EAR90979.1 hypothetical protein TTHERM_00145840 [Tetrahymena thermophila SB210]|eukprot:XP_001011224.1 hypothetical protein TTHERM_00145840 [Tetrahymena thermophila SB210]
MGQILAKCCKQKQCKILMIGSEREIKYKILQRNFEEFIKEEKGKEEFEELDIQVDQNLYIKLLDIAPDMLEEKYEKQLNKFNGIIYCTTPGYEDYDKIWIESLRENNIYLSKYILFFQDPDSDFELTDDGYPKQKVIMARYDNDNQTEKGFDWIVQSILKGRVYNSTAPQIQIQMS